MQGYFFEGSGSGIMVLEFRLRAHNFKVLV